jgi:hypothetical protein
MHGWKDNIKMGLQEVGWVSWTRLMWLKIGWVLVNAVINLWIP